MNGLDPRSVAQKLLDLLSSLGTYSESQQLCRRKAVGAAVVKVGFVVRELCRCTNGPSSDVPCSGEQGKCGCSHAEPRVIMKALKHGCIGREYILVCNYSPCSNCANQIVDSQLFKAVVWGQFTEHDPRGVEILRSGLISISKRQLVMLEPDTVNILKNLSEVE